jgi:hypothetical protein
MISKRVARSVNRKLAREESDHVEEFRKRILKWSNPVEFVNNMYGSHPGIDGGDYFKRVFSKPRKK